MDERPSSEVQPAGYTPPVVDESRDWEFGAIDVVLGVLTLPLLFWVMMYAVTGAEHLVESRSKRVRIYVLLLLVEVVASALAVWWVAVR